MVCKRCGASSETARFYASNKSACAECVKVAVRKNRAENADYYRGYDAMRYRRDYEQRRALNIAFAKSEKGKASMFASRRRYQERHPERRAAHVAVGNAIRDGRLARPDACECCGRSGKLHAHHDDYSMALAVRWLCIPCHEAVHHAAPVAASMTARA